MLSYRVLTKSEYEGVIIKYNGKSKLSSYELNLLEVFYTTKKSIKEIAYDFNYSEIAIKKQLKKSLERLGVPQDRLDYYRKNGHIKRD